MSSRHFQDMSSRRLKDVFSKTIFLFLRRFQDAFRTPLKRFCKTSSRRLQDVFKTSWKRKNCYAEDESRRLQDVLDYPRKGLINIQNTVIMNALNGVWSDT